LNPPRDVSTFSKIAREVGFVFNEWTLRGLI
jgi:hypothetical protein